MKQIVTCNNILNPYDTDVVYTSAKNSKEILDNLEVPEGCEVIISLNSEIMEEYFDIEEGDIVNVMIIPQGGGGGGKSVIAMVAMIAVAVIAPYAAAAITGYTGTMSMGAMYAASAYGTMAITAGLTIAGALLVNAVLGSQTSLTANATDLSTSTTYSWDESYNKIQQGLPVPKVYGTHKITPPLISKYIETIDNKQYWNGLYALNDGIITSVSDIKINDETIANFDNVNYEVRYGYNNQLVINNFNNTKSDKNVSRKLSTDYVDTNTNGNAVVSLSATLVFPRGLFYANDSGQITPYSVKVIIEYSKDGINWINMGSDTEVIEYWWLDNTALKMQYSSYNSGYLRDVSSFPSNIKYYRTDIGYRGIPLSWYYSYHYEGYATITGSETSTIRKTFKVNNLPPAQYKVRARFYEAPISGSRYGSDCYLEYITEEVGDDFTYPSTALLSIRALATDQLSGSAPKISCVVTANSDNPSDICKDILTTAGIPSNRFMSNFDVWKTFCTNKNLKCNIVFDSVVSLRKALDIVGTIGRGSVIQFGSKFDVIIDKADIVPVQSFTFGMGNIIKDSFKQTFLPIVDRANVIELTYYDASNDYENTVIEVSSGNFDSVAELNKTSVTLIGCTNRTQAWKHAKYLLNCNRYLTETITLQADKDSLVCKYGDIVKVSHDVPMYGISGRIESCTIQKVVLDREVSMITGKKYAIQIRDKNNNTYELPVINTQNTTNELTFTNALSTPFLEFDNYSFGEIGKTSKLFRVLKISTGDDLTRTLTLLEYNEDVYNDEVTIDIPDISSFGVSNLRATDYIRYAKDNSIETVMQLSWTGNSLYYTVTYGKVGQGINKSIKVYDNYVDLIVDDVQYNITVTDSSGKSVNLVYTVVGKTEPPPQVRNVSVTAGNSRFVVVWEYPDKPIDFSYYSVYIDGVLIGTTNTERYAGILPVLTAGNHSINVIATDTTGNVSSSSTTTLHIIPSTISNPTYVFNKENMTISWDYVEGTYGLDKFRVFSSDVEVFSKVQSASVVVSWVGDRKFTIEAYDNSGNKISVDVITTVIPPQAPIINSSISITTGVIFDYVSQVGSCGISEYVVVYKGNYISTSDTTYFIPTTKQGTYTIEVFAKDYAGNLSTGTISTQNILPPEITNISVTTSGRNINISWTPIINSFNIKDYELEYFDGVNIVKIITSPSISIEPTWMGDKLFSVRAVDLAGNIGSTVEFTHTVLPPNQPEVVGTVVGKDIVFSIAQPQGQFALQNVEVTYDDKIITVTTGTPTWTLPIFWDLSKTFNFVSIDVLGHRSSSVSQTIYISEGSVLSISTDVIDNNVLLKWSYVDGTLPIEQFRVLKGDDYNTAKEIGVCKGTFTAIFENVSGNYTYWVVPVDTAGNEGVYKGITTTVSQPPDFILNADWYSDWTGEINNMLVTGNTALLPINNLETYQQHFTTYSWSTIQDQISAGFPLWLTPNSSTASYSQVFDFTTLLGSTRVTISDPVATLIGSGSYTMTRQIETSADGVVWTSATPNAQQTFVTNIRYVRVTFTYTVSTNSLLSIGTFNVRLDAKTRKDAGSGTANSTDIGGTIVNFNLNFVDITAIAVTPKGTTPILAVYDFVDVPNPTSFKVLLFDTSGNRITGDFSWEATGY